LNGIRGLGSSDPVDQSLYCLVAVSALQVQHPGLVQALIGGVGRQFEDLIQLAEIFQ